MAGLLFLFLFLLVVVAIALLAFNDLARRILTAFNVFNKVLKDQKPVADAQEVQRDKASLRDGGVFLRMSSKHGAYGVGRESRDDREDLGTPEDSE